MSRRRARGVALLTALLASALCLPSVAAAAGKEPAKHRAAKPANGQSAAAKKSEHSEKPQPGGLDVQARSWALIDARTGEVIVSHAGARHLPIASTTKLMTAYVAMKDMPLDKIVRAQSYDPEFGESLMGLRVGQRISVRDLLYGLILRSGNDAAHTLAIAAAGSTERFVNQMNRYAAALGLADTHYANPVGLDQKGNYSSARDLATLTQRLLRIPVFAKIANSESAVLRSVRPKRKITTINELLSMAPWVNGVKTGHTFGALYVLVGSGRQKGVELISDAIGAPSDEDRFGDNIELLEYGFRQYKRRLPIHVGQDLAHASIRYTDGELPLRAGRSVAIGVRREQKISLEVRAPGEVVGPIERGAVLGHATVFVDGLKAGEVALRAGRSVPKASAFDRAREFVDNHWIPIATAMFVILIAGVLLYRRLSRRTTKGSGSG